MRRAFCALILSICACAMAQDGQLLQQRASFAYREMQQAERDVELARIEAKEADVYAADLQKQLDAVKKRSEAARARSKEAMVRAADARKRWEAANEALEKAQPRPVAKP